MDLFHEKLTDYLAGHLTESRRRRIDEIIDLRTRHVTVVLEDVYKEQNASAVVRTCECLGLQDLHVIENRHQYNVNPSVVMGSSKWINIKKYNTFEDNTKACFDSLKADGYRVIATAPEAAPGTLQELDLSNKTALVFGTEYAGLSDYALQKADATIRLPIYGFTESFNLSVSVAIALSFAIQNVRASKVEWNLSQKEKEILRLDYIRKTLKRSQVLEKKFRMSFESE